ncbi:MAG: ATP-binding protein [Acidimicrobiales bacterium]
MTRRILVSYLLMTVVILAMLTVPLGLSFASQERSRLFTAIERDARVLAATSDDAFENQDFTSLPALVKTYAKTGGRVVMVNASGMSVVDSDDLTGASRDFSTRPEIASALVGHYQKGERESATLGSSLAFVAVPVQHDGKVLGAVRVSYPSTTVDARTRSVWIKLVSLGAATLVVVGAGGWFVARTLGRPILELEGAADALASGDLAARVPLADGPDDLVRVGNTFNTMADRLQTLVESQRSFLADASHQLRTPLTALRLRIESLTEGPAGEDADPAVVDAVMAEVDRLSELVDALLAMARLDAQPGRQQAVDVAAVVADRVATWSPLVDERGVSLVVDDHAGSVTVRVNEDGLEQILDNLISNAVDYCPTGSTVTVSTSNVPVAGGPPMVCIAVGDDGPGVTEAQLLRLFDRFWRGPATGGETTEGSGLGLAIVRRIAEAAGGQASAYRVKPHGLRVEVTLPLRGD